MEKIRKRLLAWYRAHARKDLPWRKTRDPYRIWVSETMLQQTQVSTVIPYYERFLSRFPTVQTLARAPLPKVLQTWSGLGYYSRAKNLHAAAQEVASKHGGRLPEDLNELQQLPGIGRYTAGAVASIAFDRPAPILDGNVTRVLCRYFWIPEDPRGSGIRKQLWNLAQRLVPRDRPGDFNQALMELGALVCVPRSPHCAACPIAFGCEARKRGLQEQIPPPRPEPTRRLIRYLCGVLEKNGSLLLARRPVSGLLPGLWEFPGGELEPKETEAEGLRRHLRRRLGIEVRNPAFQMEIRQTLSHRELTIRAFRCLPPGGQIRPRWYAQARWVPRAQVRRLGLTAGMLKLFEKLRPAAAAACLLFLLGCAGPVPRIEPEEVKSSQRYYRVKSLKHLYGQVMRVRAVGEQLLRALPEEVRSSQKPRPSVGLLLDELDPISAGVFGISGTDAQIRAKKACLIVGVLPGGPADQAGIEPGDLLVQVGTQPTPRVAHAAGAFSRIKPDEAVPLILEREGTRFKWILTAGVRPYPVSFQVAEESAINAYAVPGQILVTTGLLRFVESDDELAVVLGHELAHLTSGHIAKGMAPNLIAGILGATVGTALDIVLPGAGGAAASGIRSPFSQDFEREADLVGLSYVHQAGYRMEAALTFWDRFATELPASLSQSYFNTHPASPERLLRLKKAIELIRGAPAG